MLNIFNNVVDHPINNSAQVYRGTILKVGPPSTAPMWTITNQNRCNLSLSIGVLDGISVRSTTGSAERKRNIIKW